MRQRSASKVAIVAVAAVCATFFTGPGAAAAATHPGPDAHAALSGTWGKAEEVPGTAAFSKSGNAQLLSVSCASAGNCSAGGYGDSGAFVVSETGGMWGKAERFPASGITSVSCASAGNCSAGGDYQGRRNTTKAFVAVES